LKRKCTLQIPIYALIHHKNPFLFYFIYAFEYSIDGIPLIFIAVVILFVVILIPRIKK